MNPGPVELAELCAIEDDRRPPHFCRNQLGHAGPHSWEAHLPFQVVLRRGNGDVLHGTQYPPDYPVDEPPTILAAGSRLYRHIWLSRGFSIEPDPAYDPQLHDTQGEA